MANYGFDRRLFCRSGPKSDEIVAVETVLCRMHSSLIVEFVRGIRESN
jgi:hypothetical protein